MSSRRSATALLHAPRRYVPGSTNSRATFVTPCRSCSSRRLSTQRQSSTQSSLAQLSYATFTSRSRSMQKKAVPSTAQFHTSASRSAQGPTADALMDTLNDLYATAKDEFEIAAEETEKKTVYAADDRQAAQDAFGSLKDAFEQAISQSDPNVGKEVQRRVGDRIRELENAIKAMEQMAMED